MRLASSAFLLHSLGTRGLSPGAAPLLAQDPQRASLARPQTRDPSMPQHTGLQALAQGAVLSSFTRTARLLAGIEPGHKRPIEMTSGDPKEAMPSFVVDKLVEAKGLLGTYPRNHGSDERGKAIAARSGGPHRRGVGIGV